MKLGTELLFLTAMQEIPLPLVDGWHQRDPSSGQRKWRRSPVAYTRVRESSTWRFCRRVQSYPKEWLLGRQHFVDI